MLGGLASPKFGREIVSDAMAVADHLPELLKQGALGKAQRGEGLDLDTLMRIRGSVVRVHLRDPDLLPQLGRQVVKERSPPRVVLPWTVLIE